MIDDVRVAVIKLAERVAGAAPRKAYEPNRRAHCSRGGFGIRAMTNQLGVWQLKWSLKTYPCVTCEDIYLGIAKQLMKRQQREQHVSAMTQSVSDLLSDHGIEATVAGRAKNIFSIWRKCRLRTSL